MMTGEITATQPIPGKTKSPDSTGIILFLPVYSQPGLLASASEREHKCAGWVFFPIQTQNLFPTIKRGSQGFLDLDLFIGTPKDQNQIFDLDPGVPEDFKSRFLRSFTFYAYGQTWTLNIRSTPKFERSISYVQPQLVFGLGTVLSLAVFSLLWTFKTNHRQALQLVEMRTESLRLSSLQAESAFREMSSLRNALDLHAIISYTDAKGTIIAINNKFCEISGYLESELIGQDHKILNSGAHPRQFWSAMWRMISKGQPWRGEVCNRAKDGSLYWVDSTIIPILDSDGNLQKVLSLRFDITGRKQVERQNERLAMIAQKTQNAVVITDAKEQVEWVNEGFTRLTGYTLEDMIGKVPGRVLQGPNSETTSKVQLRKAIRGAEPTVTEIINYDRWGNEYLVKLELLPLRDNGVLTGFMAVETDVTAERKLQDRLRREAETDRLTGLPNRQKFLSAVQSAINTQSQIGGFAVLFLDFDRFKLINDSLGHEVGDQLLKEISNRLTLVMEALDPHATHMGRSMCARLGGDEFVVLYHYQNSANEAFEFGEALLKRLSEQYKLGDHLLYSTASVGIVTNEHLPAKADEMLRDADTAMYEAKLAGKGCYRVFDSTMRDRVRSCLELENDLRYAIERDEFYVLFQPIISIATGRIEKLEALIRWEHPTFSTVTPDRFISIAEDTGYVNTIGEWVLKTAASQFVQLRSRLGVDCPATFSVNLSRNQLVQADLPETIHSILQEVGLTPADLQLEITESAIMRDKAASMKTLMSLRDMGFGLEMDDFGTGYSSLSCLQEFPIEILKIDRMFIAGIGKHRQADIMVKTVVRLAQDLGIAIVAEGIETQEQFETLHDLGCDYGQGYLFSKAVTIEQIERLAHQRWTRSVSNAA